MHQKIMGYHRDKEQDWVAELACTHNQHVRHKPPFFNRPWVMTQQGRDSKLESVLDCLHCDALRKQAPGAHVFAVCGHPKHSFSKTRQVHLIPKERLNELSNKGHAVKAGEPGESITTQGIDLLSLPRDSKLFLGATAVVQITGLREAGVMGIVLAGGSIAPHDPLLIEYPEAPFLPLESV